MEFGEDGRRRGGYFAARVQDKRETCEGNLRIYIHTQCTHTCAVLLPAATAQQRVVQAADAECAPGSLRTLRSFFLGTAAGKKETYVYIMIDKG